MCCYISSPSDNEPDAVAEVQRSASAGGVVYLALCDLQVALLQQVGVARTIAAGRTDADLDKRIVDAERGVAEAFDAYNRALCTQARGEPYRLLEASHGGVARSMRFRLAQNRTVAQIEARAARPVVGISAEAL
ncbi:hypothetical protein ABIE45_004573 [Methylobacterium sp. OAE515]|uniref:hypothetical protein n=1 Tax=Methylobacterium sp. OAE515 TaxID=2817895 RepID=UPI00178A5E6E